MNRNLTKYLVLALTLAASIAVVHADDQNGGSYAWGVDNMGVEHCYPADSSGNVLTATSPVDNSLCGAYYVWSTDDMGVEHCYEADKNGNVLLGSSPVATSLCPQH